ncbi:hypothetical protein [Sphingomonas sp.]|uniref:hypothetical protein n=1 Tax=Sphingomonas sp. TaxID=28214 RepID=UPI00286CD528|nr:hypothetical protein [Sphingomonas sp.]
MALSNRSNPLINSRRLAILLASTALVAGPAAAATYNVTDEASLIAAINAANASAGSDTIILDNAITLTGGLPTITDLTTFNTGAFALTGVSGNVVTFTGNGNVSLISGGAISGGSGAILVNGSGGFTVDNAAGGTISGTTQAIQSAGLGATTINNGGDITNGIVSTGGGNLIIDNAASGNIVRVVFGSAIDLSNGGALTLTNAGDVVGSGWGIVGRNAGDSITNSGRIASGTISGDTITSGGNQGVLLASGGSVTNLAGGQILGTTAVQTSGVTSVTNAGSITGGTGQFNRGVYFTTAGGTLDNQLGGTITGGRGVQATGTATITNAGTITSNCAAPSFQCTAIVLFNGGTITNAATGVITSSGRGIGGQGASTTTVINNGSITSTLANDIAVILFGGGSITNNATGTIANANGYGAYIFSTAGSIANAGSITGQFGASIDSTSGTVTNSGSIAGTNTGVSGFNATLGLTNSGQISGGTYGVFGNSGATNVTNLSGGTISSSGGAGIYTNTGPLTVDNQVGASINANSDGIRTGGTANVTNAGMIVATNSAGVNAGGALTLDNSGTIDGGNSGLFLNAGGMVTNSGSIISSGTGGANQDGISAFGALNLTNSGSISAAGNAGVVAFDSLLTVNNQAGGNITGGGSVFGFAINAKVGLDLTSGGTLTAGSGTTTAVLVDGNTTINLLAGSITNGDIVAIGGGSRAINVDGALNGSIDASAATSNSNVTLGTAGSLTNVLFGSADDSFTTFGGTIGGTLDGGAGNDRFTADIANGGSSSLGLDALIAFESIEKIGLGTLILTGTSASLDAAIFAGNGYNDDGLLIFDGTTGLTGDIYVNGAIIRANTAGAFGTGTIHTIDPTVQYAATGTYSNNILLSVPGDGSLDPTRLEALNSATATLTGSITQDPMVGDQYVTIGGNGTIVLTNTANLWAGTTTIDSGATLQGASDTISGGSIVVDGALNYVQPASGTVAQNISGSGRIGVSGLGAGETLTFAGNLTNSGIDLNDGSTIAIGGTANATSGIAVLINGAGATVNVLDNASVSTGNTPAIFAPVNAATVNNLGAIASTNDIAVNLAGGGVINNGSATDSNASITGGFIGVASGNALLTVDNYGLIHGTSLDGINSPILNLTNRSTGQIIGDSAIGVRGTMVTITNAGQIVGRSAGVQSNGAINLTNSGLIGSGTLSGTTFSYSDGNDGVQALNGGMINNLAGGQILGSISGIYTTGAALSVTNAGLINGANANGNGGFGIYTVGNGLTLNNLAGGTVNGATNGIADLTGNGLAITNAGTISGDTAIFNQTNGATINNLAGGQLNGVTQAIVANAAFTLTNDGSVTANNTAILTSGGGTIINRLGGTINGGSAAFQSTGVAATTITNSGDITGGVVSTGGGNLNITNNASGNIVRVVFGSAIDMSNGGRLTLSNAGDIVGSGWGVVGRNAGDVITNSGRIASGTISGDTITVGGNNAIQLDQGGSVTNLAGGQISGNVYGVISYNRLILDNRSGASITSNIEAVTSTGANSTVTNGGAIMSGTDAFDYGVYLLGANSSVTNNVGGTITAARAVQFSGANDVLNNSGTITSTAATASQGYAALFFNGGTVNNFAGGLIDGQYRGVYIAGGLGTVTNAGTIRAAIDNGVSLFGGGTVTNQLGGTITALGSGGWGIYATGGAVNLTNAGLINADTGIVTNANGAIVTNSGTINGTVNGVMSYSGTSQSLTNSGTITATNGAGVNAGGALTLDNRGTIRTNSANPVDGVTVFNGAAANITNSGTISAANASGIAVTGASSITNSGTLTGGNNATFGYGVQFAAGSSGSLVNQSGGTIGGGTGSVLVATDNAVSIDLQAGSITNGTILSAGAGSRIATVAGALNGVYNAAGGTGIDTFTLASTGSLGGALLGTGNDSFTSFGGAISVNVDGGAGTDSLLFNVAGSVTYAGNFTGFETGSKIGVGLVNLTGNNVVTAMAINAGSLAINGSLASNVSVNNGGRLGGNGLITGSVSILSGGILAPGNSIGHLTVNGPLSFAAGSIFQVETTPTAADSVSATGNITINGGTVQVLATGTAYNPLTRYTILDTPTSVTGTFANITSNLAFLTPGLEYNPRSVVLVLRRNDINFTDVAANPNQAAVAGSVQSLGVSPLYDAVLVQSADGARQAYDALSGEIYTSTQTAIFAKRDRLQDAMASNRLRSDGMSLWLDAGKSWGTFDHSTARGNATTSTDTSDLLGGFNWTRGPITVTLAGGRVIDKIEIDDRDSRAKAKSWLFGGQLAYGADLGIHAVAGGNYAAHKVSTDRAIIFPGFAETASSSRKGNGYHLFGQLGYASMVSGVTIEPFVGLARSHLKLDALSENGGLAALDVASVSRNLTTAQLGFKLSAVADLGWAKLTPRSTIAWQRVMGDTTGRTTNAFQSGGVDFDITGAALAHNAAKVGLDMDLDFGAARVTAGYAGTIGGVASDHTAKLAFQLKF